ncbi:hypothetical protein D3C87_1545730 [compost metagenome]
MSTPRAPSRTVSVPLRLALASSPVIENSEEPAPVLVASMLDASTSAPLPVIRTAVPPPSTVTVVGAAASLPPSETLALSPVMSTPVEAGPDTAVVPSRDTEP